MTTDSHDPESRASEPAEVSHETGDTSTNRFREVCTLEVLAVGAELLSGARLETNAHYIQRRLDPEGIRVTRVTVLEDDEAAIAGAIRSAARRADAVVVTGGLGPTEDDRTRAAAARALSVPLVEDPEALRSVEAFFTARNRPLKASNRRQALVPEGAEVIPNPVGTAPAFRVLVDEVPVFNLPGVPSEMKRILEDAVVPRLVELRGGEVETARTKIHAVGLPESEAGDRIAGLMRGDDPRTGITVHDARLTVSLASEGPGAARRVAEAAALVREAFGKHVFAEGGEPDLEGAVGRILIRRKIPFALAESCTGGLIGHRFTEVPGISSVFMEGMVVYQGEAKQRALGVPETVLKAYGEVSAETAEAMARGAAKRAGARLALAVTGIAGPGGGTAEKPVGLVHMAVCFDDEITAKRYLFSGDRSQVKRRTATFALDLIRRVVMEK